MKKEEQSFGCGISMSQKGHALSGWILRIVPLSLCFSPQWWQRRRATATA